jgi:tetratricopeptide (TPR) repeat protein
VSSLLEVARTQPWDFPSSAGRPLRDPARAEPLLSRRDELAAGASELGDDDANELAARAWRIWMVARDIPGGRAFLAPVVARRSASRWHALALYGDGLFAWWQGDREASQACNAEALAIAGDPETLALASLGLSRIAVDDGDHKRGLELAREARKHAAQVSEAMGQAPLHLEAQALRLAGDLDAAARLFEDSLALNRRIDDPSMVDVELHNLSAVELRRGNPGPAERYLAQLPAMTDPYGTALKQLLEASVAYVRGDADRSRELLDSMEQIELARDDQAELEWLRTKLT